MKTLKAIQCIWNYEMRRLLLSRMTYLMGFLFLSFMGFLFFLLVVNYIDIGHETPIAGAFFLFFWLPTLIWIPLLTMRTLAEERQQGTLPLFHLTQATPLCTILGKFLSIYLIYISFWSLTLLFNYILYAYGDYMNMGGEWNKSALYGGYSFILISSFLYVSIGILASSLTNSQLMAGMLAFIILFAVVVGGKLLSQVSFFTHINIFYFLDPFEHLEDFTRGIIDTRCCILYLLMGGWALGIASIAIEQKN